MEKYLIRSKTLLTLKPDYWNTKHIKIKSPIMTIGNTAFKDNHYIESVILDESVQKIKIGAFFNCVNLKEINLENIQELNNASFYNCKNLKHITLCKNLKVIPHNCFQNCSHLYDIDMSNVNIKIIEQSSFSDCSQLTKLKLSNKTQIIQANAFNNCNLAELKLPSSLTIIEPFAFANNQNLTSITIDNPNIQIDNRAFENCKSISKVIINSSAFKKEIFDNWQEIEFIIDKNNH